MIAKEKETLQLHTKAADSIRNALELNRLSKKRDGHAMGHRFQSYRQLKANIREMRAQKKIVESLYLPSYLQMTHIIEKHTTDMEMVRERFSECDAIQDRLKKLTKRIN